MTDQPAEPTKEEFCARFVTRMMKASPIYDGSAQELRDYAEQTAPTYFDEPDQRADGPDLCAQSDISYWES